MNRKSPLRILKALTVKAATFKTAAKNTLRESFQVSPKSSKAGKLLFPLLPFSKFSRRGH